MNDGKEELDELREAVRDFLTAKSPESAVRAAMQTDERYDPAVWQQMARQLRLQGLALPDQYGGDGFGLTELGVVLEEMGAALLCSPFFGTVVLAARALLESADEAACARYLPSIAAGQAMATLAVAEGSASWDPAMVATRAERVTGVRAGRSPGRRASSSTEPSLTWCWLWPAAPPGRRCSRWTAGPRGCGPSR